MHRESQSELVNPDLVAQFARDGVVCLRGLLTPPEVSLLSQGIEYNLRHPSQNSNIASPSDDLGFFFEDFCNWQAIPEYHSIIHRSKAAQVAGELLQSNRVRLFHDHVLVKEARTQQKTPWHQDLPYYNIDGSQLCSVWIPVDRVPKGTSVEFVAGSHAKEWFLPRSFMTNEAKWFPEGSLAEVPDIEGNRSLYRILSWDLEPGDAVFFHMLTIHSAPGVEGNCRRRAFSIRFIGDDVVHKPRPWVTSPSFPGLQSQLASGVTMDHPLFPVLWTRSPISGAMD